MSELPPRQKLFVKEYLVDLNATQAAIRAGYSEKTAGQQGDRLLKNVEISTAVQAAMDERAHKTSVTAEKVLEETARIAFSDLRQIFDDNGNLRPIKDLPAGVAACISSVEVVTKRIPGTDPVEVEYVSKIKFWDKVSTLGLLGKHLRLFSDRIEHTGANGGPIEITPGDPKKLTKAQLLEIAAGGSDA